MSKGFKSFSKKVLPIILTLGTVSLLTALSMLYAQGYRIELDETSNAQLKVEKTGILAVRSIPDAAKIYINGELKDTTNATLASLPIGTYTIQVQKEGFENWEKEIQVYEDLVTDMTAVLVLKGGGLNPLTNSGVDEYQVSNSGEKIVFTSEFEQKPGLYEVTLSGTPINIFQSEQKAIILDTPSVQYSKATEIHFSPNDQELLVKVEENYYLIGVTKGIAQIPETFADTTEVFAKWDETELKNKTSLAESLAVPVELRELAIGKNAVWSPDGEKILVTRKNDENVYTAEVYNFEDPLPVGEERFYNAVKYDGENINVFWYSDSKHLLLVSKNAVDLVAIDGSNKYKLYDGEVIGAKSVASPGGDKIIIKTKIKADAPANLYMISIR